MTDDAFAVPVAEAPSERKPLHIALRTPGNWFELVRFGAVGASGYVVNLVVFTTAVHGAGFDYLFAAVLAFIVALANNFFWNRFWTFRAGNGHAGFQAARFIVVSLAAFAFSVLVLYMLVEAAGVSKVPAQALAIAAATPMNFLGNKLWSFRT